MIETLPQFLRTVAERHSSRLAVVEGGNALTYGELENAVNRLAGAMRSAGVTLGDRVGLMLPNGSDFLVSYRAILASGGIAVPLDRRYQQDELRYFLERCGISLVLTDAGFEPLIDQVLASASSACRVMLASEAAQERHAFSPESVVIDPDAPVMYQFTSGSTGRPKQVGRSHRQLLRELLLLQTTLDLGPNDRFLGAAPFSHVNGLVRSLLSSQAAGATLYPVPRFERRATVELIEKERITVFIAVPVMFGVLAEGLYRSRPDLTSLRHVISSSAPMPVRQNERFREQFGTCVRQLYGSTETGTISVNLDADIAGTLESVGTPLPDIEIRVLDEQHQPVAPGVTGEVAVRGASIFGGYLDGDEVNRGAFHEGFFLTGDLGKLDEQGRLTLTGRLKFLINRAGFKVDPWEIEQLLLEHPLVAEAVVVGVPTAYGDERVKAIVVPKGLLQPKDIVDHCRGRIADFKVPSVVEFRDSLPKSPTGKVRREQLTG